MKAKQQPMIMKSEITDHWYIVTKYKAIDQERGVFEAKEKFDITDELKKWKLID